VSSRRRPVVLALVALAALAAGAVALAFTLGDAGPSPAVAEGGWSGQPILCRYREERDALGALDPGEVMELRGDSRAVLATARCEYDTADGGTPQLERARTYFVVNVGADRFDVRLVGVDAGAMPPRLAVEHDVLADGCATTADYRGQLMLLVEAPAGAPEPQVSIRRVPTPC